MIDTNKYLVDHKSNIREGIKKMDDAGIGFMLVTDEDTKVIGVFTDGDFRKAILRGVSLDAGILDIANKDFRYLGTNYSKEDVLEVFNTTIVHQLPVIEDGKLMEILLKSEFSLKKSDAVEHAQINLPVVIMAGGKGTRLEPFTDILPKPLIPINGKPIVEIIIDEYRKYGIDKFYLSVNHKSKMIKAFFEDRDGPYQLEYLEEDKPLGTAGSLSLIGQQIKTPFFVSNCDILIREDYAKILAFHQEGGFELTMVASMQHYLIPYGVCEIDNDGELISIKEKPEFDFLVNTGMYLLNPGTLDHIPKDKLFNMPDLIEVLQKKNFKVGVFPVSEKSYLDIGQWSEYKKVVKRMSVD